MMHKIFTFSCSSCLVFLLLPVLIQEILPVLSKKSLPNTMLQNSCHMFFPNSFIVLGLILRSLIHFELLYMGLNFQLCSFACMWIPGLLSIII